MTEMTQVDLLARCGATNREVTHLRKTTMTEGVDYRREGHLGKLIYMAPGLEKLAAAGIPLPVGDTPAVVEHMVKVSVAHYKNARVMTGVLGGNAVTLRCRDSKNFLPGMMVPCVLEDGMYWVRRHPRWRGKW